MHANYSSATHLNDLALLYMSSPLAFSSTVQPLPLPPQGLVFPGGSYCTVSGWGKTSYSMCHPLCCFRRLYNSGCITVVRVVRLLDMECLYCTNTVQYSVHMYSCCMLYLYNTIHMHMCSYVYCVTPIISQTARSRPLCCSHR